MATTMVSEVEEGRARIAALEALFGEVYQVAGELGAPVALLDALWAAAQGEAIPKVPPLRALDFDEVRKREDLLLQVRQTLGVSAAGELGRLGGAKTSAAKQEAARANGAKGGRPRKGLAGISGVVAETISSGRPTRYASYVKMAATLPKGRASTAARGAHKR